MKKTLAIITCALIMFSCTQSPKHPQAELINKSTRAVLTPAQISQYADSVDANLNSFEKVSSLVYMLNDVSTTVEKYSANGVPVLFVKRRVNEGLNETVEKYYLNNDSLILSNVVIKTIKDRLTSTKETRTYLRNNIAFKLDFRASDSELENIPFKEIKNFKSPILSVEALISQLNEVTSGTNKYEMVFEQYIESENGKSLLLKSKLPGGYIASVIVDDEDALIDSIKSNPGIFKNERLQFKWKLANNEAHYVASSEGNTSASGLKR
ncbi:MAG: hypothetical protein EOO92_10240 [Pedobacter sp.]|nr:MAG: hypothetical protein EOO92_10240 [Pedobacter sp.]